MELGKKLNTIDASKMLKDLEKSREYTDPPLPNI